MISSVCLACFSWHIQASSRSSWDLEQQERTESDPLPLSTRSSKRMPRNASQHANTRDRLRPCCDPSPWHPEASEASWREVPTSPLIHKPLPMSSSCRSVCGYFGGWCTRCNVYTHTVPMTSQIGCCLGAPCYRGRSAPSGRAVCCLDVAFPSAPAGGLA